MEIIGAILLVVGGGIVVYNSTLKICIIWRLAHRALVMTSFRGYWGDFFEHCVGGKFSTLIALAVALAAFLALLPIVLASSFLSWIKSRVRSRRDRHTRTVARGSLSK